MYLIEVFLPIYDNDGQAFDKADFDRVRTELMDQFGGVTAFLRSPAVGLWQDKRGEVRRDEIAIFEVMANAMDRSWWREYRERLEARFRQQEIIIRATDFERL